MSLKIDTHSMKQYEGAEKIIYYGYIANLTFSDLGLPHSFHKKRRYFPYISHKKYDISEKSKLKTGIHT
jgi:hypothetical protein